MTSTSCSVVGSILVARRSCSALYPRTPSDGVVEPSCVSNFKTVVILLSSKSAFCFRMVGVVVCSCLRLPTRYYWCDIVQLGNPCQTSPRIVTGSRWSFSFMSTSLLKAFRSSGFLYFPDPIRSYSSNAVFAVAVSLWHLAANLLGQGLNLGELRCLLCSCQLLHMAVGHT